MIKNYLKVAFRNLIRNKIYVLINTLGMGIAMACCMTAYLLIAYNLEFDNYFSDEQVANVVKVMHHQESSTGEADQTLVCPINMAPQAANEISGIENFTRFCNEYGIFSYHDNAFHENIRFADASFFQMFQLRLASGSPKNFNHQQSVFISESLAKKYFDKKNPVGETVTIELNGKKQDAVVGGVFEKLPLNISFNIDALMRIETFINAHSIKPNEWDSKYSSSVLFKLSDVNQRQAISRQMKKYARLINEKQKESRSVSFELMPFRTPVINGEVSRSSLRLPIPTVALFIFSTMGLIILLIACFNLTNTTLALTGKRLKEIGVRKVVGSGRKQIVYQFLVEMVITVLLAIGAGLLIAQFIVPEFAIMWQLQYGLNDLSKLNLITALTILLFIAALLAGLYPALLNSKFNPIELLKGKRNINGTSYFTRSLLTVQFSLSVIVLIAGIVFTQNESYQKNLDLGYDNERIFTVSVQGDQEYSRLKNSIMENPEIESVAGAADHIGPYSANHALVRLDTATFKTNMYEIGTNYFNTVGLKIKSGRDFIEDNQTDYESSVIVDENFVLNHKLKNPIDAQIFYNDKPCRIVGIVNNHLSGLKQKDDSEHIYKPAQSVDFKVMIVRADPDHILSIRAYIEKEWKKVFPGRPFESKLQNEIVFEEANGYNGNLKQIFFFITLIGCLLSACGVYALASLNVQRRTKEIGVRKVLGASVRDIIQLLSKEFAFILTLSALLGGAGGYLLTNALLNNLYRQHIEIGFVTLFLSGFTVIVIGLSATSNTIFRTAMANPTSLE